MMYGMKEAISTKKSNKISALVAYYKNVNTYELKTKTEL